MKTILFSILLILANVDSFGQSLWDDNYTLNFDDTLELQHLKIDKVSYPNNIWQVGVPQKTIFLSAYSLPKAIVTDTINPYPINDTSVFEIINQAVCCGWQYGHTVVLAGYYRVNSDTLFDYGKIEISPDNGLTWIDLINDTVYKDYYHWETTKPILSGNTNGWQHFYVNLARLGPLFKVDYNDTIIFRFTFISDSLQTNKDGLMFDNLHFEDWAEGINTIQIDNLINIFPNPTSYMLNIQQLIKSNQQSIQIFDFIGHLIINDNYFTKQQIDTKQLNNGIYLLKYTSGRNFTIKKFVVQH